MIQNIPEGFREGRPVTLSYVDHDRKKHTIGDGFRFQAEVDGAIILARLNGEDLDAYCAFPLSNEVPVKEDEVPVKEDEFIAESLERYYPPQELRTIISLRLIGRAAGLGRILAGLGGVLA